MHFFIVLVCLYILAWLLCKKSASKLARMAGSDELVEMTFPAINGSIVAAEASLDTDWDQAEAAILILNDPYILESVETLAFKFIFLCFLLELMSVSRQLGLEFESYGGRIRKVDTLLMIAGKVSLVK